MPRVRTHSNPFHYYERQSKLDLTSVFPRFNGTLDVDIGFGRGVFFRHYAARYPDRNVMGVEIRKPMVELLKERCQEMELTNVHLIHGNGHICLEDMLEDRSIDRIFAFHPDPWMKKSHHKRRLINHKFIDLMTQKLKSGGRLYITTDVEVLFRDIHETLLSHPQFSEITDDDFWFNYTSHWTEFSQQESRTVYRCVFEFTTSTASESL